MARVARAERQPAATGTTLVVMVGLGVVFLLFMAFLNVVKSGNLLNESNLLYAALIFYAGAGTLYLGFGVTGIPSYVRFASLATWAGLLANTGAIAHRWYEAGHPPFASIYEMLLSFVWTLAVLTLIAEKKYGVKVIGTVTMPVAIVGVVLMQLLRTEVHPLVPALQSTWLHVHVTLAMLAYAACALSFALAMMFLIQDKMKTETFLAATSLFGIATYLGVLTRFEKWGGLSVVAWNPEEKSEMFLAKGVRLFVVIPDLGWLMLLVLAAVAAPLALYIVWRKTENENFIDIANRAVFVSILLQVLALVFFLLRARDGRYGSLDADGLFSTSLAASPFILSGLVGGIFVSLMYLLLLWRGQASQSGRSWKVAMNLYSESNGTSARRGRASRVSPASTPIFAASTTNAASVGSPMTDSSSPTVASVHSTRPRARFRKSGGCAPATPGSRRSWRSRGLRS